MSFSTNKKFSVKGQVLGNHERVLHLDRELNTSIEDVNVALSIKFEAIALSKFHAQPKFSAKNIIDIEREFERRDPRSLVVEMDNLSRAFPSHADITRAIEAYKVAKTININRLFYEKMIGSITLQSCNHDPSGESDLIFDIGKGIVDKKLTIGSDNDESPYWKMEPDTSKEMNLSLVELHSCDFYVGARLMDKGERVRTHMETHGTMMEGIVRSSYGIGYCLQIKFLFRPDANNDSLSSTVEFHMRRGTISISYIQVKLETIKPRLDLLGIRYEKKDPHGMLRR